MVKWEYLKSEKHLDIEEADLLGLDGWEICGVATGECVWLKRPLKDPVPERCGSWVNASLLGAMPKMERCDREKDHPSSHCYAGLKWETNQELEKDPKIGGTSS